MIDPESRYARLAQTPLTALDAQGRAVRYVPRRFLAPLDSFSTLAETTVTRGDRLDLIAARTLGAAAAWWRVAEANPALDPRALTDMPDPQAAAPEGAAHRARRLRIPTPTG